MYCEVDGLPVELDLRELNAAGLFVLTPTPLPEGSEVEVFVRLGDARVSTTGSVVQSVSCELATEQGRKPGYGLLFTSLDDAGRAELRRGIDGLRSSRPPLEERALRRSSPGETTRASSPAQRSSASPAAPAQRRSLRPSPMQAASPAPVKPSSPAARRTGANTVLADPEPEPAPLVFVPSGAAPASMRSEAPTSPWWNADELKLLDELRAELASVQAKTPWAILGVSQGADAIEAKAAFHRASKRYHPHLFARYAHPAIQQVVTELFIAHKRAFTTLTKSGRGARPR